MHWTHCHIIHSGSVVSSMDLSAQGHVVVVRMTTVQILIIHPFLKRLITDLQLTPDQTLLCNYGFG